MMRHRTRLGVLFSLMMATGSVFAEDAGAQASAATAEAALVGNPEAGEKRYKRQCRQCHGPTGKGLSSYPPLIGHPAEYLVDKLKRYRAGEKIGPNTGLMAPNARRLKDQDIVDLAAFIVSLNAD